jgi:hypothetical protein
VTFDLSELRFISSLAMGVLVAFRRGAVRSGARVCLAPDPHPAVREALDRAELLGLFEAGGGAGPQIGPGPVAGDARKRYPDGDEARYACGVAWGKLVELEPQVEILLWRARTAGANCRTYTDVERVFRRVRNELAELIGFTGKHQRHPVLGSTGAYQVAYRKLYDAVAGLLRGRAAGAAASPQT